MTFKEKLVILRKAKGLTQDEFAAAVGVSRQAVYKWECGQSYPEVPKLLEMKLLFSISIDELLDDSFDIPIPEKKKRKRVSKEAAAKIENEVKKTVSIPKVAPAPRVAPAPQAAPMPRVTPAPQAAPAPQAVPAYRPIPNVAPATPKVAPASTAAPTYSYTAPTIPTIPVVEENEAPIAPKEERTIFIPTPIELEENEETNVNSPVEEDKNETKKSGLFSRFFGRK